MSAKLNMQEIGSGEKLSAKLNVQVKNQQKLKETKQQTTIIIKDNIKTSNKTIATLNKSVSAATETRKIYYQQKQ